MQHRPRGILKQFRFAKPAPNIRNAVTIFYAVHK